MEKQIIHPIIGIVTLRKRINNRNIRISVNSKKGIVVSMPWIVPYNKGIEFLEKNIKWVEKTLEKQKLTLNKNLENGRALPSPSSREEIETLRKRARKDLVPLLYNLAINYGFTRRASGNIIPLYEKVFIKNNISNWGSCSGKNNINLNMRLVLLPAELKKYVLLHELCHLRHHNHGKEFHALLNNLLEGEEKSLRSELRTWRLL